MSWALAENIAPALRNLAVDPSGFYSAFSAFPFIIVSSAMVGRACTHAWPTHRVTLFRSVLTVETTIGRLYALAVFSPEQCCQPTVDDHCGELRKVDRPLGLEPATI